MTIEQKAERSLGGATCSLEGLRTDTAPILVPPVALRGRDLDLIKAADQHHGRGCSHGRTADKAEVSVLPLWNVLVRTFNVARHVTTRTRTTVCYARSPTALNQSAQGTFYMFFLS